jgi:NitT/TauT family transport system substrate-binding protein
MYYTRTFRRFAVAAAMLVSAAAAHAQTGKVWRHGILEAKSDAGILFMAGKGGFAEKLGLKLEYVQLKSDITGLKAMLAGEVDSFEGGPQAALLAAARGADAKIVGCQWFAIPHGIFVRKEINSLKDLQGKPVAISIPGSLPELLMRGALEQKKIPAYSVNMASMGSDIDRYKALVAGVVEAAVVSAEYTPRAAKENVKLLISGREIFPKFVRTCLHMTGKTIAERGDDATKFLAAEMLALRYVITHKNETIALTRKLTNAKEDDPRASFIYDLVVKEKMVNPDLPVPFDGLDWMQNQLITIGKLDKPGDIHKMVDETVRAKAFELANKSKP